MQIPHKLPDPVTILGGSERLKGISHEGKEREGGPGLVVEGRDITQLWSVLHII